MEKNNDVTGNTEKKEKCASFAWRAAASSRFVISEIDFVPCSLSLESAIKREELYLQISLQPRVQGLIIIECDTLSDDIES